MTTFMATYSEYLIIWLFRNDFEIEVEEKPIKSFKFDFQSNLVMQMEIRQYPKPK